MKVGANVAVASPILALHHSSNREACYGDTEFGFEVFDSDGLMIFMGLFLLRKK